MAHSPLFYQHLEAFRQLIPSSVDHPAIHTNDNHYKDYLHSYLSHYDIDWVKQGIANQHHIWQSQIHGYTIIQQQWTPKRPSKGGVIICHGYFDHTGLYGQLIQWLLQQNYTVVSFDLPGHGLSSGPTASISHFSEYSDVLAGVIADYQRQHTNDGQAIYAIGQSTGCAVIAHYLMTHPTSTLQHAMLLAPLIRSTGWTTMRWVYFLCKPFLSSVKRHFIPSSHNRIFNDFLKHHDPIQSQRVFLKWLGAMEEWYQQMREPHASSNTTPITIIQGTGDMTVDWKYNIPILQQSFNHTHVHYIKKAKHQLVNESRKYWQKVTHIMEQTLQAPADTSP